MMRKKERRHTRERKDEKERIDEKEERREQKEERSDHREEGGQNKEAGKETIKKRTYQQREGRKSGNRQEIRKIKESGMDIKTTTKRREKRE